jgi:hypothetical protein
VSPIPNALLNISERLQRRFATTSLLAIAKIAPHIPAQVRIPLIFTSSSLRIINQPTTQSTVRSIKRMMGRNFLITGCFPLIYILISWNMKLIVFASAERIIRVVHMV